MAKKKITRLHKEFYVEDEYGHTDMMLVKKVNELISVVNYQQKIIRELETMLKRKWKKRRNKLCREDGYLQKTEC